MWAISCASTSNRVRSFQSPPMHVIIGYSMPPQLEGPSTTVMCG